MPIRFVQGRTFGDSFWRAIVPLTLMLSLLTRDVNAADPPTPGTKIAERPWAAVWVASLARILAACDIIYDSVERPDLADSLEERQTSYNEFQGLDRTRPLGMMWGWDDETEPSAIIFLPIQQIEDLMKTATFGVVGYHKVNDSQYEIERPGAPYHVLLRSGYAMLGEEVPAIHALRNAPDRMTKELKDKYDAVLMLDQRQVSRASKQRWVDSIRVQVEPWLQPQDDEAAESAVLRRTLGKTLLDFIEQVIEDVQTVTVGLRIDRRTYQLQIDLILQSEPGSTMSAELNKLVVRRSEFSALVNRNAAAGLAINWPLTFLGKELPGVTGVQAKGERLDLGVQLIGSDWTDMAIIAGLRGAEATALNAAIPHFLSRMEKSSEFKSVTRNVVTYREVTVHKIAPVRVPDVLHAFIHPESEVLVGQGKDTVWLAAGMPLGLQERLQAAIDTVEDTPAAERSGAVMQGRLAVSKWPKVVPIVQQDDVRQALETAKDGFSVTVQPVANGIKLQFIAEEGLLRVIGKHWARQVDENSVN